MLRRANSLLRVRLGCCALQEARAKVEALFGGCYGEQLSGPMYSLADIDPTLLSLMVRFRRESGAKLQLPEDMVIYNDQAETVEAEAAVSAGIPHGMNCDNQQGTQVASTGGSLDTVVMSERGYSAASDVNEPGAGRLNAGGWTCPGGSCRSESRAPAWKRNGTHGRERGAPVGRVGFGNSMSRLPIASRGAGRASPTAGNGVPGSATRMRAATRKTQT